MSQAAPPLVRSLQALAEPSRLRLLRLLDRAELSVGELAECTGLPQSSVSRHLAALRAAGLVDERTEGVRTYARRAAEPGADTAALLAPVLEAVRAPGFGHDGDLAALPRVLQARETEREAVFDSLAGDWDALRDELLGGRPTHAELGALLLPPGLRVVDAGAGTGVHLAALSALAGPGGRVIAVERSAEMAARARRRAADLANVEVRKGRIEDLPVDDGWADAVLLSLSLGQVADPVAALRRCARAVRPGGRVVVADVERHADSALVTRLGAGFRGFAADEIVAAMTGAGLEDAHAVSFGAPADEPGPPSRRPRARRWSARTPLQPLYCVASAPRRRGTDVRSPSPRRKS